LPEVKNVYTNKVNRGSPYQRTQTSLEQLIAKAHAALEKNKLDVLGKPRLIRHARDSMVVTTTAWNRYSPENGIFLYANPSDMRWSMPRRGTNIKTAAGTVRNVWRNRYRGTYYDEGTVGITFQSGNIMPAMGYQDNIELSTADRVAQAVAAPRVPPGLLNFYKFIELLDQPMLLGPAGNRHVLIHHSRVFPNLYMEGYFLEDSFNFSEVSTDGNRLQWEATFQIYRTEPPLYGSRAANGLIQTYQGWISNSAQDEQIGWENLTQYLYVDGVSDLPGTFPAGNPKQGPTSAKQPTTVASLSDKQKTLVDQAVNKVKNDRSIAPLFGF